MRGARPTRGFEMRGHMEGPLDTESRIDKMSQDGALNTGTLN